MSLPALPRRTRARLVVLDELNRVLLMRISDSGMSLWITLGGGVEAGESFSDAAQRELWEEAGFDAAVGPVIWTGEQVLSRSGVATHLVEQFFLVRTSGEPSRAGWTDEERQVVQELRWWSLADMRASDDVFKPPGLAELLDELVAQVPVRPRPIELR